MDIDGCVANRHAWCCGTPASITERESGTATTLVADGHFGNLTHAAVTAFQRKNGLTVDGVVGDETWKALEAHPLAAELVH